MIDIHCHLLYGVDDGCKTIEESISKIEKAISVGITDIILTPHYAPKRGYVVGKDEIKKRFDTLKEQVKALNLDVNIYLGREIDEIEGVDELLKSGEIETMNNSEYVLIDFGMRKTDIDEYCYELVINGYIPIIAHPERYNYIDDYKLYHKWRKTGALIQINATSIFKTKNKKTKKNVNYLLKNNLVDFLASDTHTLLEHYDVFKKSYEMILKKYKRNAIIDNPKKIIEGVRKNA